MAQRSPRPTLKQRFGPYPLGGPRTTWQRLDRARTDSGWPLLTVNLATYALFAAYALDRAAAGSVLCTVLGAAFALGAVRTSYVMLCVARGRTAAPVAAAPAQADRPTPLAPTGPAARPAARTATPEQVPQSPRHRIERLAA
ncbi:hypothetical protein AB0K43_25970 [Kitasatospora sp. NPDC049258]|uniref:hypothetical protein n=1 Tax=Kitasatospora sp. NPDC049258 TaxID=3155394 RepID=UPI00344592F3